MMFLHKSLALALIAMVVLVGCGGSGGPAAPPPTGGNSIVVNPNPDSVAAAWHLAGPASYSHDGVGDETLSSMTPGDYTITWANKSGWVTPTPATESKTLTSGGSITFTSTYRRPQPGDITTLYLLDFENSLGQWTTLPVAIARGDTSVLKLYCGPAPSIRVRVHVYTENRVTGDRTTQYAHSGQRSLLFDYLSSLKGIADPAACTPYYGGTTNPERFTAEYIGPPMDLSSVTYGDSVWVSYWILPLATSGENWSKTPESYGVKFTSWRSGSSDGSDVFFAGLGFLSQHRGEWVKVQYDWSRYAGTMNQVGFAFEVEPESELFYQLYNDNPGGTFAVKFAIDDFTVRVKRAVR